MLGGRGDTYPFTSNTSSIILKVRVTDTMRNTSASCAITANITYLIFINTIIYMARINMYTQQSTMVALVMGGRVVGLGTISTSPITIVSLSRIGREKMDGPFRPIYALLPSPTHISPLDFKLAWIIFLPPSPPSKLISPFLFFMYIFINTKRIDWWSKNIPLSPGLWEEECLVWDLYPTLPSTSTLYPKLKEEECLVSCSLHPPLLTSLLW